MRHFLCKTQRYIVQAKRKNTDEKWSDWTTVDDYDEAVRHANHVTEVGYESRIVDREEKK